MTPVDFTGKRFGRLFVLEEAPYGPPPKSGQQRWRCVCDCGNPRVVVTSSLRKGESKSCGCLRAEKSSQRRTTHGMSKTPTYRSWHHAKERCFNPNDANHAIYGARGITMCEAWKSSFAAFLADMGAKPSGMSLDRIDVNGNYEPANCRWASNFVQSENKRKAVLWRGIPASLSTVARDCEVPKGHLQVLVKLGMPLDGAIDYAKSYAAQGSKIQGQPRLPWLPSGLQREPRRKPSRR